MEASVDKMTTGLPHLRFVGASSLDEISPRFDELFDDINIPSRFSGIRSNAFETLNEKRKRTLNEPNTRTNALTFDIAVKRYTLFCGQQDAKQQRKAFGCAMLFLSHHRTRMNGQN